MEVGDLCLELGLDPQHIISTAPISSRHGHRIFRIAPLQPSFVLKRFPRKASEALEVAVYKLLQALGVPTLPVYGLTPAAILLEDLSSSVQ